MLNFWLLGAVILIVLSVLADELNVRENVEFLGYVGDTSKVYKKAHIVLMCSNNEGLGRVTIEAMAAHRPVIGKMGGGTSEIITDGYNGMLYDGSDECLVECILKLSNDHRLIREIVFNALEYIKNNFTIEEYAEKIYIHIQQACNKRLK